SGLKSGPRKGAISQAMSTGVLAVLAPDAGLTLARAAGTGHGPARMVCAPIIKPCASTLARLHTTTAVCGKRSGKTALGCLRAQRLRIRALPRRVKPPRWPSFRKNGWVLTAHGNGTRRFGARHRVRCG